MIYKRIDEINQKKLEEKEMVNVKGKFIVFEGLDGSGKTTQLELLHKRLVDIKKKCYVTREPSDNVPGLITRGAVKGTILLEQETMALLFAADRYEHIIKNIIPHLNNGTHVLCDRYYFSNLAYQSTTMDMQKLLSYNEMSISKLRPDITFFLDVSPEECIKRISFNRAEEELYENINNSIAVRDNYFKAFKLLKDHEKIEIVDTNDDANRIFEQIWLKLIREIFEGDDLI